MARTLAEMTDAELEAQFLEAERNAMVWAELTVVTQGAARASRWMQIAGELQAEMMRRSNRG